MIVSRLQHLVSSAAVFAVAIVVTWLSFTQQPADAFLFPRLISIFFIVLAAWNFIRAASGLAKVGEGVDVSLIKNILLGFAVILIYVFIAARGLGFYTSSTLAFMTIYTLYDPTEFSDKRAWLKRAVITICFITVMYCLFALLLKVQTPRGVFF